MAKLAGLFYGERNICPASFKSPSSDYVDFTAMIEAIHLLNQ